MTTDQFVKDEDVLYSQVLRQLIFLDPNQESGLRIRNVEFFDLTTRIDRLLLTIAILTEGNYTDSSEGPDFSSIKANLINQFSSVFLYFITNPVIVKSSDTFKSTWHRSKSGHWSFIVT
jgi:hypothetical protein